MGTLKLADSIIESFDRSLLFKILLLGTDHINTMLSGQYIHPKGMIKQFFEY